MRKLFADDVETVPASGVEVRVPGTSELALWQDAIRRIRARCKARIDSQGIVKIEAVIEQSRKS